MEPNTLPVQPQPDTLEPITQPIVEPVAQPVVQTPQVAQAQYVGITAELPDQQPEPPARESKGSIISTIGILIAAPLVALLLTAFVFQSYEVDGPSMEATLDNHDRLLVLKLPRTFAKLTGQNYIPKRYDVIIFNTSAVHALGEGEKTQLIKRVIGLPGERVVVKNGEVTLYNTQHPKGYKVDDFTNYKANLPEITTGEVDITVPNNEIFVMGDNRVNSTDSRIIGPIPAGDIVGKLVFRIYPLHDAQIF